MHQNVDEIRISTPEEHLDADWALFQSVEAGAPGHLCRCWEATRPVVVVGRNSRDRRPTSSRRPAARTACRVLRRFSGGGAVVLGPGCLNYAVGVVARFAAGAGRRRRQLSVHPRTDRGRAGRRRACRSRAGRDLALDGRKVSGNAQRRGRRALLHHGTLLYDFDRGACGPLSEGAGPPAGLPRGAPARGVHRESAALAETLRARLEAAWRTVPANADTALSLRPARLTYA